MVGLLVAAAPWTGAARSRLDERDVSAAGPIAAAAVDVDPVPDQHPGEGDVAEEAGSPAAAAERGVRALDPLSLTLLGRCLPGEPQPLPSATRSEASMAPAAWLLTRQGSPVAKRCATITITLEIRHCRSTADRLFRKAAPAMRDMRGRAFSATPGRCGLRAHARQAASLGPERRPSRGERSEHAARRGPASHAGPLGFQFFEVVDDEAAVAFGALSQDPLSDRLEDFGDRGHLGAAGAVVACHCRNSRPGCVSPLSGRRTPGGSL